MRRIKGALVGGGIALALAVPLGVIGSAHAGLTTCRADPAVTLSNGQTLTLVDSVGADASNITAVYYTLHIPKGLKVTRTVFDAYGSVEHFSWVADQNGSYYIDTTTAQTSSLAPNAPVTAWASFPNGNNTYSTSGTAGQTLTVQWRM